MAIRTARKRRHLSQEKLAALSGVDRSFISGVERGERNISLQTLVTIARELELEMDIVFREAASED